MNKKILKALILNLTLLLCITCLTVSVSAQAVDSDKVGSLTLVYKHNSTFYDGLDIKIYRVADVQPDYSFDLSAPFDTYSVNIHGINSQNEWRTVTTTLASYILADGIAPTASQKTDSNGKVAFENLLPGIYLVAGMQTKTGEVVTKFEDFLTIIPTQNEDYSLSYDITAYPKCEIHTVGSDEPGNSEVTYEVIKQWKDNGKSEKRAKSIKVDIFRNGVLKETATLSSANNWKYSWKTDNDGADWTVIERNVPIEYTVGISKSGYTFIVTNTYTYDEIPKPSDNYNPTTSPYNHTTPTLPNKENSPTSPNPPYTGDISSVNLYIILMCISGLLLILLSVVLKRKKLWAK